MCPVTSLCPSCMEEHEIQQEQVTEVNIFKGKPVEYLAKYEYCPNTGTYTASDDLIDENDLSLKDAYKKLVGLLTSKEIQGIRGKYGVSQKDFSKILGWGSSTITRYENHQVQDKVHDDVLRKVDRDPKWFLELLDRAKDELSQKAYYKYRKQAQKIYHNQRNRYLKDALEALYAKFCDNPSVTGNTKLNIDKAIEVINYLAANVQNLHKVKLMKMMWYADFLHYKKEKRSITGLAYVALPLGAVPEGYKTLLSFEDVCYEEIQYGENIGYKFYPAPGFQIKELTDSEKQTLDQIIDYFQHYSAKEIIAHMHGEEAYLKTEKLALISYDYAEKLSLIDS
ncbi:MAG: type II TA system antitoxin MqsA family protein [bacterium]